MEWLLVLLAAGGGVGGVRYVVTRRRSRREHDEELAAVQRLADEDVIVFGEQLQRLDSEVASRPLDTETRVHYQRALDAYESAQRAVHHLGDAEEVSQVTDTLSHGRYALACVQARVAGRPLPELRPPCFFNPQHGPSTQDVLWTTGKHGTRRVPACAQDAARVTAREKPEVRMADIGGRRVPYWGAGAAFLPYSKGYFPAGTYAFAAIAVEAHQAQIWGPLAAGGGIGGGLGDFGGGDFGGGDFGGGGGDAGGF